MTPPTLRAPIYPKGDSRRGLELRCFREETWHHRFYSEEITELAKISFGSGVSLSTRWKICRQLPQSWATRNLAREFDTDLSFAEIGIFANRKIRSRPRELLEEVPPNTYRDGIETRQLFFGYRRANGSWPGSRTTVSLD